MTINDSKIAFLIFYRLPFNCLSMTHQGWKKKNNIYYNVHLGVSEPNNTTSHKAYSSWDGGLAGANGSVHVLVGCYSNYYPPCIPRLLLLFLHDILRVLSSLVADPHHPSHLQECRENIKHKTLMVEIMV